MSPLAIGVSAWLGGNVLLVPILWTLRLLRDRRRDRLIALFERALQSSGQRERPPV